MNKFEIYSQSLYIENQKIMSNEKKNCFWLTDNWVINENKETVGKHKMKKTIEMFYILTTSPFQSFIGFPCLWLPKYRHILKKTIVVLKERGKVGK